MSHNYLFLILSFYLYFFIIIYLIKFIRINISIIILELVVSGDKELDIAITYHFIKVFECTVQEQII
jgi:hypothetical protein